MKDVAASFGQLIYGFLIKSAARGLDDVCLCLFPADNEHSVYLTVHGLIKLPCSVCGAITADRDMR